MRKKIERVHVVFKTHLDIGFTDLAKNVVDRYFFDFIPRAMDVADELRAERGRPRLIWTVGSWLVDEYLSRARGAELARFEAALRDGTIAWHAMPFTTHTELMDESLADFALSIAKRLDRRFGKNTIAAKLTDVPGHTIALVPVLARAGVRYLHIGVNGGSRVPETPPLFRWRASDGSEVVVQYSGNYGEEAAFDGLTDALVIAHGADNRGPPDALMVKAEFARLQAKYPGAEVFASTLDAFAERLLAVAPMLPVVTDEIGDTWIRGVASDPRKVSRLRELQRLRVRRLADGSLDPESEEHRIFSSKLLLLCEHTWGLDFKKHLGDYRNWSKADFTAARKADLVAEDAVPPEARIYDDFAGGELVELGTAGAAGGRKRRYSFFEASHAEKRAYVDEAVAALPPALHAEAVAAFAAAESVRRPPRPFAVSGAGSADVSAGVSVTLGSRKPTFGPDGALLSILDRADRCFSRLSLGVFRYETFGSEDYAAFHRDYNRDFEANEAWVVPDFGKPGMERAVPRPRRLLFSPRLTDIDTVFNTAVGAEGAEIVLTLRMDEEACEAAAAPRELIVRWFFPSDEGRATTVSCDLFDKDATRLPEALWFSFVFPQSAAGGEVLLTKLGRELNPLDVVRGGNRYCHAVDDVVLRSGRTGGALGGPGHPGALGDRSGPGHPGDCAGSGGRITSFDAPLVSLGERSVLRADDRTADPAQGLHFCLYNNLWGTNFPLWWGGDARFRFELSSGLFSNGV